MFNKLIERLFEKCTCIGTCVHVKKNKLCIKFKLISKHKNFSKMPPKKQNVHLSMARQVKRYKVDDEEDQNSNDNDNLSENFSQLSLSDKEIQTEITLKLQNNYEEGNTIYLLLM